MKVVIDISEDVYTRLYDNGIQDNEIAVDDVCEMARALRLGTTLPSEDAISREEAVKAIYGYSINIEMSRGIGQYKTQITNMLQSVHEAQKKLIENLPSVTPAENVAHWIVHPKGVYAHIVCSNCLTCAPYDCETNYCPKCGRKMEVTQDELQKT